MNIDKAVEACRKIELVAPAFGCHVALTGGCLYKKGNRKDLDVVFYRIRQAPSIEIEGLIEALGLIGFSDISGFGWIFKGTYEGEPVDMLFPEEIGGGIYEENMESPEAHQ